MSEQMQRWRIFSVEKVLRHAGVITCTTRGNGFNSQPATEGPVEDSASRPKNPSTSVRIDSVVTHSKASTNLPRGLPRLFQIRKSNDEDCNDDELSA